MATKPKPFDKAFLDQQRQALIEKRATYGRQAEALKAEADMLTEDYGSADTSFDEEGGEGTSVAIERDFGLARSAAAIAAVEDIDRALAKIDAGTYGICEVSGELIPQDRLEAIPWTRVRIEHKVTGFG